MRTLLSLDCLLQFEELAQILHSLLHFMECKSENIIILKNNSALANSRKIHYSSDGE